MRDMKNNVDIARSLDPATYKTDQTGVGVDLSGYNAAMAVVVSGALTDGTHTPKLQESDDNVTFTDVAASDMEGSFSNVAVSAVQRVGYKGSLRYIRTFVASSGATGCVYCASVVRGEPAIAPLA